METRVSPNLQCDYDLWHARAAIGKSLAGIEPIRDAPGRSRVAAGLVEGRPRGGSLFAPVPAHNLALATRTMEDAR